MRLLDCRSVVLVAFCVSPGLFASDEPPIVGRWDLTVRGAERTFPSWIEIRSSGKDHLIAEFVGKGGSARPVARVSWSESEVRFSVPPQWEKGPYDLQFEGRLTTADRLAGSLTDSFGVRLEWTGVRAPSLRGTTRQKWAKPVQLFNGADLSNWKPIGDPNQWQVINRILINTDEGANLVTKQSFRDFRLHVEFRYPPGGNSGVYLRGRYEVQIADTTGEPSKLDLGALYGFIAPNQDAATGPNQWQSLDVTLVGRLVTVVLNGKTVICAGNIPGITGGALDSDEAAPGPILLQGDHGPIEFRKIVLIPAK